MEKVREELGKIFASPPRLAFALLSWTLMLMSSLLLTVWLDIRLKFSLAAWAFVMSFSVRPFMVSVPEYTKLVTINLFTGVLKEYKTGLWFRFPWEQAKEGNYINLRLLPLEKEEDYPAKDGPKMHTKWQAPYRVINAIKYIGVGREGVEDLLKNGGSSVLSAYIATHGAQEAKDNQEEAEKALKAKFDNMKLEEMCGVEIPVVSLADLDYEPIVQKVRATKYVAERIKEIAKNLQAQEAGKVGVKPMSDSDALTAAMVLHGNATQHVNEVKGEGGNALAALLMGMAQGGGAKKGDDKK